MSKLASLIVDLQVDNAALRSGLDQANAKLDDFGKKLNDLAGVVVFEKLAKMAFEAAKGLANIALKGAESADKMGKLAQSTGTTVEQFSQFAYAGELSGVSAEALSGAMVKLDKAMVGAAAGGKAQVEVFRQLGVKATDTTGALRPVDAVLADVAERFSDMEDGAGKTALAVDLFGKSGAELLPFLNLGRDGLAELAAEADRLGITITTSAAASAEAFNDNLAKLEMAMNAVGQRAAAELTPALTTLTDELLYSEEGTAALKMAAGALATALRVLASGGVIIGAVFESVGKSIARVASAIANVVAGRFSEALTDIKEHAKDMADASDGALDRLTAIWDSSAKGAEKAARAHKKAAKEIGKAIQSVAHSEEATSRHAEGPRHEGGAGHESGPRHGGEESSHEASAPEALPDPAPLKSWFDEMSGMLAAGGTQMLGAVGDLVSSIGQGAEAGGVWGAMLAAFMEIAKKTESALAFLDTAMQFVEKIAAMVEPLVKPIFQALQGVLEIVADVVAPVFAALQPFFDAIATLVENLSPILWAIGDLFASLSPIIEFIGTVIGKLFEFLKPVFDIIGAVIKTIATVILGVLIGLNELAAAFGDKQAAAEAKRMRAAVDSMWKDADKAKSSFNARATTGDVTATGKVTATGAVEMKAFDLTEYLGTSGMMDVIDIGGWGYAAGSMAGAEAARAFVEASKLMVGATAEEAAAAGQAAFDDFLALGSAADDAAKSLATFSGNMTNVPEGFRYAAAAFNAQGAGDERVFDDTEQTMNVTLLLDGEVIAANLERRSRRQRARSPIGHLR